MGEADEQPDEPDTEEWRCYQWRRLRFLELGFNRRQSAALALAAADWHQAARLLKRGCNVPTAFDLLS